jgi:hypothetical protein
MKKNVFLIIVLSFLFTSNFAQTARLSFALYSPKVRITIVDPLVNFDPAKPSTLLRPDAGGTYSYTAQVSKPRYVVAYLSTPDTSLFISPFLSSGDDLKFNVSLINKKVVFKARRICVYRDGFIALSRRYFAQSCMASHQATGVN